MGEGTQSPRAEVLAARAEVGAALGRLDEELVRLEASARAAVDVKARLRRQPVKVAGAAAGLAFLAVGGPRRVLRRTRSAIFGAPNPLPASMLPKEIDASLRKLGVDGEKVRGVIERDFARYLDEKAPERKQRDLPGSIAKLLTTFGQPLAKRYAGRVADQLMRPDGPSFAEQLDRVRARRASQNGG